MSKIPTVEEFLKEVSPNDKFGLRIDLGNSKKHIYEIMRRFAKLHVEAALKEAAKKVIVNNYIGEGGIKVSKNSILNAYPLENIK
jgi:hypothetical protein